jgi:adenylate kinase
MNIIFLGAPGAGKGPQARKLDAEFDLVQLSTGDMLRESQSSNTEIGKKVASIMNPGELVSDEIVISLIKERLSKTHARGFIFDGFPRTIGQASALDKLLDIHDTCITAVIEMKVDNEALVDRITGRYSCGECGEVYHERSKPLLSTSVCIKCGAAKLKKRVDDNEESLRTRLDEYNNKTAPLIEYYLNKGILYSVDGLADIEVINSAINKILLK